MTAKDLNPASHRPLEGIVVADLSHVLAGPLCTFQLALLGAEVIKVEMPGDGDLLRQLGSDPSLNRRRMSSPFLSLNAGKRCITANLKSPGGRAVVERLVGRADVLVENFRAGVLERLGLGWDHVRELNPRLIYCSLSGFGQQGPWRDKPAYDHILQAVSGIMALTGTANSGPVKAGFPAVDAASGYLTAFAVLAALMGRHQSGKGAFVDVSMLESVLALMSTQVADYLITGNPPPRVGNAGFSGTPVSDCFAAPEGPLLIAANTEGQFRDLMTALDLGHLIDDPRFAEWEPRVANGGALKAEIEAALAARPAAEWEARLNAADVPAGVVRSVPDVLDEPQVRERGYIAEADVPALERRIEVPTTPFTIDGQRPQPGGVAAELGADTEAVLAELGYAADEIAALRAEGDI